MKAVRWKEAAAVEAGEAAAYYEERSERGGKRFLEQLWTAIAFVREYPEAGTPFPLPFRRVLLRSFPYSIIYVPEAETVYILAVRHDRMMPVRWEDSLE